MLIKLKNRKELEEELLRYQSKMRKAVKNLHKTSRPYERALLQQDLESYTIEIDEIQTKLQVL